MKYTEYHKSRDAAWQILLDLQIDHLPVKVSDVCRRLGITVKLYESSDQNDGFCTVVDGKAVIFVNKKCPPSRQRFTAAHELGHLILGHVGTFRHLVNREPSSQDNPIEQAANVFASRLLAPACVLWGCRIGNAAQLAKLCDISQTAAEFRMHRMKLLYERDKFLTSPLEREVYSQFYDFIMENQRHP